MPELHSINLMCKVEFLACNEIRYLSTGSKNYNYVAQSADSIGSSFVDSPAQHRGMRSNLIAMKNKILKANTS